MTFPGGTITLPSQLLSTNMSGPTRVHPPEPPIGLTRITDAALMRLADNLATLMEEHAAKPGGVTPGLRDYIDLLTLQVEQEIMRRM